MRQILAKRRRHNPWFNALLVSTLFAMGTIMIVMELYYAQKAWIDLRNYPGGPTAYFYLEEAQPINTAAAVASTITVLVGDALLVRPEFFSIVVCIAETSSRFGDVLSSGVRRGWWSSCPSCNGSSSAASHSCTTSI
jgi:hypothetical protein